MAENDNAVATNTQVQQPKIASLGKIQKVDMTFPKDQNTIPQNTQSTTTEQPHNTTNNGANATSDASNGATTANANAAPAPITDEQLKEYFKSQGIDYEGVDKLKEKLNYRPETAPTEEQIKEAAKAREKRVVDKFVAGGGTYEQYTAMKSVAEADVTELSKNTLKIELKSAGFNDTEIEDIIKERYYQIEVEELEQLDTETDEDFEKRKESIKRKKEYGAKKLANRSLPIKNQAAGVLAGLQQAIESEDLQAKNELTLSSNIDEQFKKMSRKETYEIGEINGKAITPIESEVPEKELAEAFQKLIDPAKRKQFLENQDGTVNIANIANLIAENAKLKAALKVSYHEGSTRTNAHWEKTFGARSPHELGVGGATQNAQPTNGKKVPTSVGKVQRVMPQRQ